MKQRFALRSGALVLSESSRALPVVGVSLSLRTGSLFDPQGKEGLARLMTRAMRMGTKDLRSLELEETLDRLGAQLSMSCSQSYMHFGGVVVAHNLEPFLDLLAAVLQRPAFRPADVRQAKREMIADLTALCDDDRSLCARHFRSYAFHDHPYGRPRSGSRTSVARIEPSDVVRHHRRHLCGRNVVIGVWGDFAPSKLETLLDHRFGRLSTQAPPKLALPEPTLAKGRRILIVDKPERTQTQILVGTLGTSPHDADHVPLIVANAAFGGLFSSRLTSEVRGKRGLSYGANSSFTLSRTRDLWAMHTFPAARDALACLELQLELYDAWVRRGVTAREVRAAKSYLVKGHAFEVDTAAKRLDHVLDVELLGWPKSHHGRFVERVRRVSPIAACRALQRRLSREDQVIVVVATADQIRPELEKLDRVERIEVVRFDEI
ncbi:MAG: M16 family metallopeptidase [Polyangiales bacterium]